MSTQSIIETERLLLRRVTTDDLDDFAAMLADPEVMRYYPHPLTREESLASIHRILNQYAEHNYGLWATVLKEENRLIGRCGLIQQQIDGVQELEIGYMLASQYWCRGLATEAAQAIRDYAFGRLGATRLISIIHPDNIASQRVALKNGMHHEKNSEFKGLLCRIYSITKPCAAS